MAIPTSISDLNSTASSNSPAGTDAIGTTLDDYIRALSAILRQVSDAKADLTSASLVTPDLGTPSAGVLTNCTGTAAGLTAGTATTATTATTANRVDSGEVTVTAHATTGDIFAAAANSILWDDSGGAITTTIFPDAPKAGIVRELRCNGASKFTTGANLLIEGIPSGTTITMADGALVKVRAITTSQFKMTYSLSGTFTMGCTGLTTSPTVTARYTVKNGFVNLTWNMAGTGFSGTSNSTSFTLTGLPACLRIITNLITLSLVGAQDNGAWVAARPYLQAADSSIGLVPNNTAAAWTNSGAKGLYASSMSWAII